MLIILSLSCSVSSLINSERDTTPNEPSTQSEKRCGDNVCDGPENPTNCPEDCQSLSEDNLAPPELENSESLKLAPWFLEDSECFMRESSVRSEGSPWAFDKQGNTTELLPDGQVTCVLEIQVCGDTIFKQQVVETDEGCPEYYHYSYAPPTAVCCELWEEAKLTDTPCNPLKDADCDGITNESDTFPLDFSQQ